MNKKFLFDITINDYLRVVNLSKKQNPKYFIWDNHTIKAKGKPLFKKFIKNEFYNEINKTGYVTPFHLTDDVCIIGFKGNKPYIKVQVSEEKDRLMYIPFESLTNKQTKTKTKYYLCYKDTLERVVANPTQNGKPKKHIIKGQDFYVGLNPFIRNKIVSELKEDYAKKIVDLNLKEASEGFFVALKNIANKNLPLYIHLYIYDTLDNELDKAKGRWDVGNRAVPYMKTFVDFISNEYNYEGIHIVPIIKDDDRTNIIGEGYTLIPINDVTKRKLVFKFYTLT